VATQWLRLQICNLHCFGSVPSRVPGSVRTHLPNWLGGQRCCFGSHKAERCNDSSPIPDGRCIVYSGETVYGRPVVARGYAAEVIEPSEHTLDGIAFPVQVRRETRPPAPIAFRRDIGHDAALSELPADRIAVISLVRMQDVCGRQVVEKYLSAFAIGHLEKPFPGSAAA